MREHGFTSESPSLEARTDVLRRRIELYRVCLSHGIGRATAADYVREIAVAEAELEELLRASSRQEIECGGALLSAPRACGDE
jgi:hypothetical protein